MIQPSEATHDPRDAAAYWFARVHSGAFTPAEENAFQQWRNADPVHANEYRALEAIWQASHQIPDDELRAMLQAAQEQDAAEETDVFAAPCGNTLSANLTGTVIRRPWWQGLPAICSAVLLVASTAALAYLNTPVFTAEYTTAVGQQRTETLPDGSTVTLNTQSRLIASYYPQKRSVQLVQGEALFNVAHNADKAFTVQADETQVRVTGTQFAVRLNAQSAQEHVSVAVQSGSVEVRTGPWWQRLAQTATRLGTNQRTTTNHNGQAQPVQTADVDALTAWRDGKLIFRNQPLAQVVQEMNRYLQQPIHLADQRLAQQHVSGIFNISSADEFLQTLRKTLPVTAKARPDGGIDLRQR